LGSYINNTHYGGKIMSIQGRDCTITIKTEYRSINLPYAEETVRDAISILKEEAPIEGDGICRGIAKNAGVTGCIVTPLTIETTPLLFLLAFGSGGKAVYVSETRNLYRQNIVLSPKEDGYVFDLVQERGGSRKLYEGCRVEGFEFRIMRDEVIKMRLDISGDKAPVSYKFPEQVKKVRSERFSELGVSYEVNGNANKDIYSFSMESHKTGGVHTEVKIHRILRPEEFPAAIENFTIHAQLYRSQYEERSFGLFRLNFTRLVLMADETVIDSGDTVIGFLRYYVAGQVQAEIFTADDKVLI
jgi:hypothetical protein